MTRPTPMGRPFRILTAADAVDIRRNLAQGWLQSRIAAHYDVNPGRISEINTGKRFPPRAGA